MTEQFANDAVTSLNGFIAADATSLTVRDASAFPTTGDFRLRVDAELMLVTAVADKVFTVTRGIEGSTAVAHASGTEVKHVLTAASLVKVIFDRGVAIPDDAVPGDVLFFDGTNLSKVAGPKTDGFVVTLVGGVPTWAGGGGGAFDPSTGSPTGWWRTDFSSSPWADDSGHSRTLTGGNPPSTGTALNSKIPADFDGSTQRIDSAAQLDVFMPPSGAGLAILFNADTAAADEANFYNAPALVSSLAAIRFALTFSTSGVRAGVYNGSDFSAVTPYVACATGGWHWVFVWWDATNIYIQLDGGSPQSHAIGGAITLDTYTLRLGANYNTTALFDGRIAECITFATLPATTDLQSYGSDRYGL